MSDSVADLGGSNKLTNLVENRLDGFVLKLGVHLIKLVEPKISKSLVVEAGNNLLTIGLVGENLDNVSKVGARGVDQSQNSIAQDMLESGSPGNLAIELLEDRDDSGGDQLALGVVVGLEDIERIGIIGISWVEVAAVIEPMGGDIIKDCVAKITMRIDDGHTPALADVVDGHIVDESSFTGTGFTNDVHMTTAVLALFDAKDSIGVAKFGAGKKSDRLFLLIGEIGGDREVFGGISVELFAPGDIGDGGQLGGEVPEGSDFLSVEDLTGGGRVESAGESGSGEFGFGKKTGCSRMEEVASGVGKNTKRGGNSGEKAWVGG